MDGEPWFPAKDVCDVLGLTNARQAVQKNCQPEDVQTVFRSKVSTGDVSFPARGMNCVSEAGLYELVFASRRPEARAFRRWVAATVLPAISKDGMYVRGEESVETEESEEDPSSDPVIEPPVNGQLHRNGRNRLDS